MAQPATRVHRIGVLVPFPAGVLASFFDALRQLGFVEGQNLAIDGRGFVANYEKFPTIAAELVKAKVDAILCAGDAAIRAAQAATTTIPIIAGTDDMVGEHQARDHHANQDVTDRGARHRADDDRKHRGWDNGAERVQQLGRRGKSDARRGRVAGSWRKHEAD